MPTEKNPEKNITFGVTASAPWRLTHVKPLLGYKLEVAFMDGTHGFVEMHHLITGKNAGVFAALKNMEEFNKVYLVLGVATWPGNIDLSPDTMYDEIKKNGTWVLKH